MILLCGVPASGKTWVMNNLPKDKFECVHNDNFIRQPKMWHVKEIASHAKYGTKQVIADCPFAEREFRSMIENQDLEVRPIFILERPNIVAMRYLKREGKPASAAILTHADTIKTRIGEWGADFGTSQEILSLLTREYG